MKRLFPAVSVVLCLLAARSFAGSATWNFNPATGNWNKASSWTPATVPNGPGDIATFDVSNTTDVVLAASITLNGIMFNAGASAFTISTYLETLEIEGSGITNDSGVTQMFLVPTDLAGDRGLLEFFNTATAGGNTSYIIEGSEAGTDGGRINFWDSSTAGDASFVLEGGSQNAGTAGGIIFFMDTSTAGNATFNCQPGGSGSGVLSAVDFVDNSSAGNATLIAEGVNGVGSFNGTVLIRGESTAANATLIANDGRPGGVLYFDESSTGDHATVKVYGNGNLKMPIAGTSLTIGSLEGDGLVFLSDKELTVGNNGQSTTFSGIIQDSGSLVKIKKGKFVLTNANTYTGGTTVKGGSLFANNSDGSATGNGPVKVNAGTLAGRGIIAGPVTVGSGGAFLAPAGSEIGILNLEAGLTFKAQATYLVQLNSGSARADKVVANGVTIDSAALISITDLNNTVLASGTVFRVINNISATPTAGTFSNLADSGTVVIGSNALQANYKGGDGNDLTLTVVP